MIIFIDFDDVLLDTRSFVQEYLRVFPRFGVPFPVALETYSAINQEFGTYDSALHMKMLKGRFPALSVVHLTQDLDALRKRTQQYVFGESAPFLEYWRTQGARLELVSSANPTAQKIKVEGSGLAHFFDKINLVWTNADKVDVIRSGLRESEGRASFFLDDKKINVESVKHGVPSVRTIQVVRRSDQERASVVDAIVKNLSEATNFIHGV